MEWWLSNGGDHTTATNGATTVIKLRFAAIHRITALPTAPPCATAAAGATA